MIDAEITIATTAGRVSGHYRLWTTLTDPDTHRALDLVRLYRERWEIETCYAEIKSSVLGGRVLRAQTPAGIEQEIYALLTAYQVLRIAMTDATDSLPGTDPDRASFTVALNAARDQITQAQGVIDETVIDLVGVIGQQVLAHLLPHDERAPRTASSNAPSPSTTPAARTSTAPPTQPPSPSKPSQRALDTNPQRQTERRWF